MMVRYSGATGARWRGATAAASATGIMVGAVAGVGCVVVGLLLPDPIGPALIALGVLMPGLMLQDSLRFAFFATGRPRSALLNDVVWTVLLLLALVIVHRAGDQGRHRRGGALPRWPLARPPSSRRCLGFTRLGCSPGPAGRRMAARTPPALVPLPG